MGLSYYNLIPESVYGITSVTSKKTRTFETGIGTFIYKKIKPGLIFGYRLINIKKRRDATRVYKIAEPEKVILDYFYLNPDIKTGKDFESIRINQEEFRNKIDIGKLEQYLKIFDNKALNKRMNNFLTFIKCWI